MRVPVNNESNMKHLNQDKKTHPFTWKKTLIATLLTTASTLSVAGTAVSNDDWLHVEGNQVVDANNNPVWLTGANWFGFNATERVFHGLWSVNLESTLDSIAARGINILRVPISTELLLEWKNGIYKQTSVNTATNPDLIGATSLEVFDAFLAHSKKIGLKVLLDVHSAEADNSGHIEKMWYKGDITSEDFYAAWGWVAERYANDDTIVAFDLENEPHGKPWSDTDFAKWDNSTDQNNWKYACETAANRVLDANPNMLVMCEGIESFPTDGVTWTSKDKNDYLNNWWGGNLRGVKDFPVDLGERQAQFMYSPHDYGPLVYQQGWFYEGFDKESLYNDVWKDNWMFIHEQNIAPLLIGEWGGFMDGGDNEKWMLAIRDLIVENKLHHTFWCINPNSGDTGGLLENDWVSWDEEKYALFKPSLWANEDGKFISLDHQVALGSEATGISLNQYFSNLTPSVSIVSPATGTNVLTGSDITISYALTQIESVNVYVNNVLVESDAATAGQVVVTAPMLEGDLVVQLVGVDAEGKELEVNDQLTLNVVNEVVLNPQISLTEPATGTSVEANTPININVDLIDAAGFEATFNGVTTVFTGTTGTVTAPNVAGTYPLLVTALDTENTPLSVTDSVDIEVTAAPVVEPSALTCTVGDINAWNTGFVIGNITVENTGTEPVNNWSIQLNFENAVDYVSGWNADFAINDNTFTATNKEYNGTLAVGQSTSFGMQGSYSGSLVTPTCTAN